jgi:Carbohydrate-selective porin, OprB family
VWRQHDSTAAVAGSGRTLASDTGFFFQHDERWLAHPGDPKDHSGANLILRFGWAQADRTAVSRFFDASFAWHGLGLRGDDTVGIGGGYFTSGPGDETFVEAFYKWRITAFASVQPDLQLYRHHGETGADAVVLGGRVKLKL